MDHLQHPNLKSLQIPVFFKLCRLEGISFDIATQVTTGVPTFTINLCVNSCTTLDVGSLVYSSTFIEGFIQDPSKKNAHNAYGPGQVGTIVNIGGNIARGVVGILAISRSRKASQERAMCSLRFIRHIVSVDINAVQVGIKT